MQVCGDQVIDDNVWQKIISEIDQDASGDIDFNEFSEMMKMLLIES